MNDFVVSGIGNLPMHQKFRPFPNYYGFQKTVFFLGTSTKI